MIVYFGDENFLSGSYTSGLQSDYFTIIEKLEGLEDYEMYGISDEGIVILIPPIVNGSNHVYVGRAEEIRFLIKNGKGIKTGEEIMEELERCKTGKDGAVVVQIETDKNYGAKIVEARMKLSDRTAFVEKPVVPQIKFINSTDRETSFGIGGANGKDDLKYSADLNMAGQIYLDLYRRLISSADLDKVIAQLNQVIE